MNSRAESERRVACLVTRVAVSADDEAFRRPTKPIGPFFSEAEAKEMERAHGWHMVEDAGRGWRYVVASPLPRQILDIDLIASLAKQGVIVIAAGGGGIPMVLRADGSYGGVPAVVDKDLSSALLASQPGYDTLLIHTAVQRVALDFGKPEQRFLETVAGTRGPEEGHFPGKHGPKVKATLRFLAAGGKRAVIAHPTKRLMRSPARQGRMSLRLTQGRSRLPACAPGRRKCSHRSSAAATWKHPPASPAWAARDSAWDR
jgi:carbamate kinase